MIALVTGTTSGIGRVTAEGIAAAGHELVMACRDPTRAEAVRREIASRTGNTRIHIVRCDLSALTSVRACAAEVRGRWDRLDLLVNNAGMMTTRFQTSPEGLELTFAANYLGPWLLTRLLLDRLENAAVAGGPARIVNVASTVHRRGTLDPDTLGRETGRGFSGMQAYARSKLGNVMATLSLAERVPPSAVTVNCLHPGVVATNIVGGTNAVLRIGMKLVSPLFLDPVRGAATSLHLALSPALAGVTGSYYDEHQQQAAPAAAALDSRARDALWAWSSRFCAVPETPAGIAA